MADNVVIQNIASEEVVYEDVSAVELLTEDGDTATFIHDAEILYENLPDKPFGDIPAILEETELTFSVHSYPEGDIYGADVTNVPDIIVGESYIVNWDGTEYTCVCRDDAVNEVFGSPGKRLGNDTKLYGAGTDTGEPFLYCYNADRATYQIGTLDTSATHTVSIRLADSVIKIDPKYLPDNIGGGNLPEGFLYERETLTKIMPSITVRFVYASRFGAYVSSVGFDKTGSSTDDTIAKFPFTFGDECVVVWDGIQYDVTVFDISSVMPGTIGAIGNGTNFGLPGNGEPFAIGWDENGVTFISTVDTEPAEHTIIIYQKKTAKTLDNNYLDFMEINEGTDFIPETAFTFSYYSDGELWASPSVSVTEEALSLINSGEKVTVVIDGTKYEEVNVLSDFLEDGALEELWIGNMSLSAFSTEDTGEPFLINVLFDHTDGVTSGTLIIALQKSASSNTSETIERTVRVCYGVPEKIKEDYLPDPPEFDLTAMGFPDIPLDGNYVSVDCDTTALREAAAKGLVKTKIAIRGLVLEGISTMAYVPEVDVYSYTSTAILMNAPFVLEIQVTATNIIGRVVALSVPTT